MNSTNSINCLIEFALKEDIGSGDITTNALIPANQKSAAIITAKESGIVAGLALIKLIYQKLSPNIKVAFKVKEGARVKEGSVVAVVKGPIRAILSGERTVLNFLQRLSGIATLTNQFVKKVSGYKVKILDTRKTVPGWRLLDKYAVKIGNGFNHRFGLDDAILIKNNHLSALNPKKTEQFSSTIKALEIISQSRRAKHKSIEIEVGNLDEFSIALIFLTDRFALLTTSKAPRKAIIMLDNMIPREIKKAVEIRNKTNRNIMLEASGGITLNNIKQFASTGVDYISIGVLTHSPKALDISLKII
jgi:nicotinate-nucleotide pyrophosphorylase (carboxylating)